MFTEQNSEKNIQMTKDEQKVRETINDLLSEYEKNEIDVKEPEINTLNAGEKCCLIVFNLIFMIFIYPICWGLFAVQPLEAKVLMFLGKVIKVIKTPGLKWFFPIGMEIRTVSLGMVNLGINTMEIKGSSVPDKNGSPMNVSAIITYQVLNPMAFLFNVDDSKMYIHDQGSEVLKKIMSRFDYMSTDPSVPSLLDDTMVIGWVYYTK
jgi:hypothetical protein